jgi:hypothetical protein
MTKLIRKTTPPIIDEYDWAELFMQFRQNPSKPYVRRVRRILELLKALTPRGKRQKDKVQMMQSHAELGGLLKGYQWRSIVSPTAQGVMEIVCSPMGLLGEEKWEFDAVRWLLNIFRERGELDLVHLCEMHETRAECAGWFYGRSNKTFCTDACKQYRYDCEEAIKARRARNATHNREYRDNLNRKQAKEKESVGYKGPYSLRVRRGVSEKLNSKNARKFLR